MADPTNPYMPSGLDRLSMMLMAMGSGVSGAEASGRSGWAGIPAGAAMYSQANQQQNQQAMQYGHWQQQHQQQESYRKAQEENLRSQIDERKRAAGLEEKLMGMVPGLMQPQGGGGPPGMGVPPPTPTMGPGPELLRDGPQKVQYLTEKHGLPPVAAAGVVGNLYQESGFRPTAVGDGGTAYGMAQWRGDRQQALTAFAQAQGKPPSDPTVQMDFLVSEMKGGDMGAQRAYAMLQTAKTPADATTAMMHFFRPAGYTPSNPQGGNAYQQRVQYAQALLPSGPQPAPMPGAPPGLAPNATMAQMPGAPAGLVPPGPPMAPMPQVGGPAPGIPGPIAQGSDGSGNPVQPQQPAPQMPGPPPNLTRFAPLALSPRLAPLGNVLQKNEQNQYEHGWKAYDATTKQQQFDQEQLMRERSQGATERNQDVVLGPDGRPRINDTAVAAKTAVSAAQGTDTTGKMLLGDYDDVRKANTEIQAGAMTARTGLMQTNRLAGLLDHMVTTGKFTSSTQQIKQMAKGIGINLEALGVQDDTAPAQAVEALRGQMALALRNPAGGAGMPGAMSDADRNYLDKMVGGLENTPEANKLIIGASRKVYQRQIDIARIANDFMRSPEAKKDPNAIYQKLQDYAEKNPLFDEKDLPQPKAKPGSLPMPNTDGSPRALRWNPAKGALE